MHRKVDELQHVIVTAVTHDLDLAIHSESVANVAQRVRYLLYRVHTPVCRVLDGNDDAVASLSYE